MGQHGSEQHSLLGEFGLGVGVGGWGAWGWGDVGRVVAVASHFADDVDGDAQGPGLQLAVGGESWELAEEAEGGFLGGLTGLVDVAEEGEAKSEPVILKQAKEGRLCVAATGLSCLDDGQVHACCS